MTAEQSRITTTEVVKALQRAGWRPIRQVGKHVQLTPGDRSGRVITIAVYPGRIVPAATLKEILERSGLSSDELDGLL